jgi:subtilisin family serine protease
VSTRRLLCWIVSASLVVIAAALPAAAQPEAGPPEAGDGEPPEPGPDVAGDTARVLVRPASSDAALERVLAEHDAAIVDDLSELGYLVVQATDAGVDVDQLADSLDDSPTVDEVVVDHRRQLFVPVRTPNDPYLYDQADELWNVRAEHAWAITTGSADVVVAVVDTGVDRSHPDLKGRVLDGRDLVAGGTRPPDPNGHGTAVAGVIAARGDDGIGIAGMAWKSRILPVRVLDQHGWGWDSDVAAGIVWAADQGARVINLSLGGPSPSPVLEAAVAHATAKGALVVAAAGNDGTDEPMYPAAISGVVAVGAANVFGQLTEFSSFGPWIDVTAPGVDVLTTIPRAKGSYAYVSGTSIAAPFVSGTAALVLGRWPTRTPPQARSALRPTPPEAGPPGIDAYVGWGGGGAGAAGGGAPAHARLPPAYDAHEPNDVPGRATPLVAGTTATGTISPEGDEDWYLLELAEASTVTVRVGPPGYSPDYLASSLEPIVAVLDPSLRVVAADVGVPHEPLHVTADLPAGTAYVAVSNVNGSTMEDTYSIRADATAAPPFRSGTTVADLGSRGESLAMGDVTGDGIDDVVVTTWSQNVGLHVFAGQAEGGFVAAGSYTTGPLEGGAAGVATLDLDGDGLEDVVVAAPAGLQAFLQREGALERADGEASLFPPSNRPWLVATGDVTGDGQVEVVSTGWDGTWLYARGEQGWTRSPISGARYTELAIADLDDDGAAEVIGLLYSRRVHVHRLVGGTWSDESTVTSTGAGENSRAMAIADMNGDGRVDVVVSVGTSAASSNVRSLLQQEDGSFVPGTPRPVATNPNVIEAADVDGDGAVDVVAVHYGRVITLVRGDGLGGFHAATTTSVPQTPAGLNTHSLALFDVDRDERLDVLAVNSTGLNWYAGGLQLPDGPADVWVRNLSPAPHARNASRTPQIRIDLARDVQPSSITTSTIRLRDGRTGTALAATRTYDAARRRITLVPEAPLVAGATYRVDVGRLRDVDGGVHDDLVWLPFTVARDAVAPKPVTNLAAAGRVGAVDLAWTNPADADLAYVEVWKGFDSYPTPGKSGMLLHRGRGTKLTIAATDISSGHLAVFAYDRSGNRSSRATVRVRRSTLAGSAGGTITHGAATTIRGELFDMEAGRDLGGRKVELLHRPAGQSSWSRAATATTASDGSVSFSRKPTVTTAYRLRFAGDSTYIGREKTVGTVKVRSAVTAKLSATSVKKGATVRLTAVAPGTRAI